MLVSFVSRVLSPSARTPWESKEPVREELFSAERLEEHGLSLAAAQHVSARRTRGNSLSRRLKDDGNVLLEAYRNTVEAMAEGRAVTPASEWLVDNYHLVERQIREIQSDLPDGFYRQLPKLVDGPFAGYPRIFGIAWAFVAHTDSRFDAELLLRFVKAYQSVQPLTIGELWAMSVTLRIVLVENLRRLAQYIVHNRLERRDADRLADRLLGVNGQAPEPVEDVLSARASGPLPNTFVVQLVHRLRDQDPRITPALDWLDRRLSETGTSPDDIVREVHRQQGASNVSVRNIITSLRLVSDVNWRDLVEASSLVDGILAGGSGYSDMDFATRNLYRSAIEQLARGAGLTEIEVAQRVMRAVGDAGSGDERLADPGYFLLASGRPGLEMDLGYRQPLRSRLARLNDAIGIQGYAAAILLVSAIVLLAPVLILSWLGLALIPLLVLAALGAIPAVDAAVALVNRAVSAGFQARRLPALALRGGIPDHLRTVVAVPTLLTSQSSIDEQIERLEVHYLASPDDNLHFALLSDWKDCASESDPSDEVLLAAAASGIGVLNARHGPAKAGPRFLLLHRRRLWAESEGRWIGWERKRGKLHEMNRWLRGARDTSIMPVDGTMPLPPHAVRYVITLDADTRLPRDTVLKLIGKMGHPLNHPRFDADSGRVAEGYAILQPRVTPSLPIGQEGSLFQRIFSSVSGIDPYASAVSDVYQDMFGEGSYAGKGIYDVDAFEASLEGRIPPSTLLSHDLFEGIFARAGLASDVEVVEDFPSRYDIGALRHHRWARGDWQLLPWLLGRVPPESASSSSKPIPQVGRWKMIDNLRRTLTAPLAILALSAGWLLPPVAALVWTAFILATIVIPPIIPVIAAIPPRRAGITMASHFRALGGDFRLSLALSGLVITFLAHQAWLMGDAIIRTLYRVFISHRTLLEWVPAAQSGTGRSLTLASFYRQMAGALAVAAAAVALSIAAGQGSWPLALLFGLVWCASPAIALCVSLTPSGSGQVPVTAADVRALRLTARRTWRFFESFVTPGDNMLPPDNFQEVPTPVLAHRTSPTNIGLYLLSVVSARDFGWIATREAIERLQATIETMGQLEHFKGHLLNWYDTRDLRPLEPRYVSSVDSGNLAGHLIALANACREWRQSPQAPEQSLAGIADAIDIAREETAKLRDGPRTQTVTWAQLDDALAALASTTRLPLEAGDTLALRLKALSIAADTVADIALALSSERGAVSCRDMLFWVQAIGGTIDAHSADTGDRDAHLEALEATSRAMALDMDFAFLLDRDRMLLSIGYLVNEGKLDENCYDLLASEARLASFFAIAKGDIPARHWFRLGRSVTPVAHAAALVSWSGSMFEYLMPSLVMRAPAGSLIEQTSRLIVRRQIDYGTSLGLPWGISESAYNARDLEFTYQYSNFGVPDLGLKRGLAENIVIAPYASALAAMVDPAAATTNLARIGHAGGLGSHGFYESLDYTPSRLPEGTDVAIVKAFMAHHQGMTIVAIADTLLDGRMRARFHAEPIIQATELLLQERMPRDVSVARPWAAEVKSGTRVRDTDTGGGRRFSSARQAAPATLLLSNGRFTTMLTAAASGYSTWGRIALTRWREDSTRDDHGSYVYLRDVNSGAVWSAGVQPIGSEPDACEVNFSEDRAEFARRDGTLSTMLEVLVSPEEDAEVRRVSITNTGRTARLIDVTSYAEIALAPQADDMAHPAFSKLFVETGYVADVGLITASRRKRAAGEAELWAGHLAVVEGDAIGKPQIETDRARFLGRGHGMRTPIAVMDGRDLSNTTGTVLDPIFALRQRVQVQPGSTVRIVYWTMAASSRQALLDCADKHRDAASFSRAATLAWTQAQVQLHHLGITAGEAAAFQQLAGHLIFATPALRPSSGTILRGAGAQSGLWSQGISGDLPILLLRISDSENLDIAHELLQAHEYWRMKGLAADLVILNERQSSYVQDFHIALETLVRTMTTRARPSSGEQVQGRVFVLRADLIPAETRLLLSSVARVVLVAQRGNLLDQLERLAEISAAFGAASARAIPTDNSPAASLAMPDLEFFNGLGGFADDGRQYVTVLGPGQSTPAPWINVIANPAFGFQVAADGGGYTWSVNSRENQITPWSNDPVTDRAGEAFYLRDEDSGAVWSPTAQPIRDPRATYLARHGWGFSRFEHTGHGIASDLVQFVPLDDSVKISRLTLRNTSARTRRLSVTAYVEWVLGRSRSGTLAFVTTSIDPATGAMLAANPWSRDFGSRVAFADLRGRQTDWTGDRREFIGRNGALSSPAALRSAAPLSKATGAGLDPCGALRTRIELAPNASIEVVFLLGQAASAEAARSCITRFRAANLDAVQADVAAHWQDVLGSVQVKTPDRAMDIMLNGWLMYQTIACRLWARSGFYQSSGAYGFRDQLQDGMAVASVRPDMTRRHLLAAAARQFPEGDVQHWWLPHTGQGVRTRISDDRGWLALAVAHYVETSGDAGVLDEPVPFLEGQMLEPREHDSFFLPGMSEQAATLFEHCALALDQSLATGRHGLPLIGTGDWNDGMNRVGEKGEGESVWLGWFLFSALTTFIPLAEARGEADRAMRWRTHASKLTSALADEGWDGAWYLRGFYDDGTPLGSSLSEECQIDSIAQSWSVLSGASDTARSRMAMDALEHSLIKPAEGLALLFAPPFDKTAQDPGYIKGYPPGIRENGGQYTHAASWTVMAMAKLGEGNKAHALFAMLNPINHARRRSDVLRYKVEPYVVAADIYAAPPHAGRGGWTWYTGSAGWMQRAGLEAILGLKVEGAFLHLSPCIPGGWPSYEMTYRHRSAIYEISVENGEGVMQGITELVMDGVTYSTVPARLPLHDDGKLHKVRVRLGGSAGLPTSRG